MLGRDLGLPKVAGRLEIQGFPGARALARLLVSPGLTYLAATMVVEGRLSPLHP